MIFQLLTVYSDLWSDKNRYPKPTKQKKQNKTQNQNKHKIKKINLSFSNVQISVLEV